MCDCTLYITKPALDPVKLKLTPETHLVKRWWLITSLFFYRSETIFGHQEKLKNDIISELLLLRGLTGERFKLIWSHLQIPKYGMVLIFSCKSWSVNSECPETAKGQEKLDSHLASFIKVKVPLKNLWEWFILSKHFEDRFQMCRLSHGTFMSHA